MELGAWGWGFAPGPWPPLSASPALALGALLAPSGFGFGRLSLRGGGGAQYDG